MQQWTLVGRQKLLAEMSFFYRSGRKKWLRATSGFVQLGLDVAAMGDNANPGFCSGRNAEPGIGNKYLSLLPSRTAVPGRSSSNAPTAQSRVR